MPRGVMFAGLLASALAFAVAARVHAAPPRVVVASPDNADLVNASVSELRVTFDQDMNPGGRSICGGGPTFPALAGQPRWESPRVLVLPIKLEPGKAYSLSINCGAARNFRGVNGESAEIYPISFTTAADGQSAPTLTREHAGELIATLRREIDERYSHRDVRGVDWNERFAAADESLRNAPTPAAFARAAAAMLSVNQDLHLTIEVNGARLATGKRLVEPNVNWRALPTLVGKWTQGREIASGVFDDGIAYIAINAWTAAASAEAIAALDAMKDAPALIVDVRLNGGGDEMAAREFAARFVAEPTVYSKSKIRDPDAGPGSNAAGDPGWRGPFDRVVEPAKHAARFTGKVAVLIGPVCMSSNESFVLMMRSPTAQPPRKLVGSRTYGSSGNPRPRSIGHGITIYVPTWIDMQPDGTPMEGVGVQPDITAEFSPGANSDAVIDAALQWLRAK